MATIRSSASDAYGTRLSHLEGQVGGLSIQVNGLSEGLGEVGQKIDKIIDRMGQHREINWGWVVAALLGLGAVITLYTNPIKELTQTNASNVIALEEQIQEIRDEQVQSHAKQAADFKALKDKVDEIDNYGSRRWLNPGGLLNPAKK